MNTSEIRATAIQFKKHYFKILLNNEKSLKVPYKDWATLNNASPKQRENYQLLSNGLGIHWKEIDEDLSVAGLIKRYS